MLEKTALFGLVCSSILPNWEKISVWECQKCPIFGKVSINNMEDILSHTEIVDIDWNKDGS